MEHHNASSKALTNDRACYAKQANLPQSPEPQHKVGNKVLVSTTNINIKNVSTKLKSPCTGPITILLANYKCNNYSLYLSRDPSLNVTYNNFHISKVNSFAYNNSTLFPQLEVEKPGPVS